MDDPTIRRSLGLLCLAAVCLVIGLALKAGDGTADGLGTALASLGFFVGLFALARVGLHLFRN
jgi:hypothetical protein